MTNTTVKSLPDPVYQRLRQRAAQNHRSVNQEMVQILSAAVGMPSGDMGLPDLLAPARAGYSGPPVDAALIAELRDAGRP